MSGAVRNGIRVARALYNAGPLVQAARQLAAPAIGGFVGRIGQHLWRTQYGGPSAARTQAFRNMGGAGGGGGGGGFTPYLSHNFTRTDSGMPAYRSQGRFMRSRRVQRRYPRRIARRRRVVRRRASTEYVIRRFAVTSVVAITDNTTNIGGALTTSPTNAFTTAGKSGWEELVKLYEQYKIVKHEADFRFDRNGVNVNSGEPGMYPLFLYVDTNDATAPTDPTVAMQHAGCRRGSCFDGKVYRISCAPRVLTTVDGGVLTSAKGPQWLDCATGANLVHYGIKYLIERDGTTTTTNAHVGHMHIQQVITIAFRKPRPSAA